MESNFVKLNLIEGSRFILNRVSCPAMEVIIKGDGTNNRKVLNFAQLKSIAVKDMQTLTRFYSHERNMGSNSTNSTDISSDHFGLRQEKKIICGTYHGFLM